MINWKKKECDDQTIMDAIGLDRVKFAVRLWRDVPISFGKLTFLFNTLLFTVRNIEY